MAKACSKKIELLDDLINGFLDVEKEAVLNEHLDKCENCRKYYSDIVAVKKALGSLEISAPPDTVEKIMRAVKRDDAKNKNKWFKPLYVASYASAAGIILVLAIFFLNGGLFNRATMESSELFESNEETKNAVAQRIPGEVNFSENSDGILSDAGALPIPAPESDSQVIEVRERGVTAKILESDGFNFNTSAFSGDYTMMYNKDGEDIAETFGFGGDAQDILYATANYNIEEVTEILFNEFGIRTTETGDMYILTIIPASVITAVESRLDLAAGELVESDLASYSVRIITLD